MKLTDIKEYLDTLCESFAAVLNLEFTITNIDPLERVAGSNDWFKTHGSAYREDEMRPEWKNGFSLQMAATKKPVIVRDALAYMEKYYYDDRKFDFANYALIGHPILVGPEEKVEGCVYFASFDKEQKKLIETKEDQLLLCIEKISNLIASKLEQEDLVDQMRVLNNNLTYVVETMEEGALLISSNGEIRHINKLAKIYLHLDEPKLGEMLLQDVKEVAENTVKTHRNNIREIHRTVDDFQFLLQVKSLYVNESDGDVLCIISPFSQIQEQINQTEGDTNGIENQLVFADKKMRELVSQATVTARHNTNVLITGESGTGKELFARLIHAKSSRKDGPFVAMNCAAIPESLMESELFGYEEGAFTGARKGGKIGKIQLAHKGTFFLDEIGEMPLYLQAKLLRVLSERKIDRIGSNSNSLIDVDVRIIAATNRNLEEMIERKEFREDLYYRLNVVPLHLPPLRERAGDIPVLVQYFLGKYDKILEKDIRGVSTLVLEKLMEYCWPGNVRELENCVEYMMTFEKSNVISMDVLPEKINSLKSENGEGEKKTLKELLHEKEVDVLKNKVKKYGGQPTKKQIKEICDELDISVASYYRKMNEFIKE
ncbi:Nif-specific regulatory protein [uncultured Clostridium sp.]|uniref:sigma-54 interaction domain-containing protein n=1 Tax=Pilosibacter sp. HC1M1C21 TaxID=3378803 RepID=UPI0008213C75|nr:Nif-specific regulatory protein [uncultured Clostridium sp.]